MITGSPEDSRGGFLCMNADRFHGVPSEVASVNQRSMVPATCHTLVAVGWRIVMSSETSLSLTIRSRTVGVGFGVL